MKKNKDSIYFLHANGFPPNAYLKLLNKLRVDFKINAPLLRSFWNPLPKEPIKDWKILANDFSSYIKNHNQLVNNVGIGHSIGGTLLLYTAIKNPDFFSKIILLDPVIFSNTKCLLWKILKNAGLGLYFHPLAKKALYRKKQFNSKDEIFNRYRKKKIFYKFSNEALNIYIDSIINNNINNIELNFSTQIESDIYLSGLSLEPTIFKKINNIKSKVYIMYADIGSTISESSIDYLSKKKKINKIKMLKLTHLFPMEDSNLVYDRIKEILI